MMKTIEYISVNILSLGWIIADTATNILNDIPTIVTVLIGLSIVFLNIARGLHWLKKNKK